MTKQEVLNRLCALVTDIGDSHFENLLPHDCFCGENNFSKEEDFQCAESIIVFIENAVKFKIRQNGLSVISNVIETVA